MLIHRLFFLAVLWIALTFSASAASPLRVPTGFQYTWDVGSERSVYVVGNHPDLGAWDAQRAVRLYWTPGNVWTGTVGVQAGTLLEYKYIARVNALNQYCEATNVNWIAGSNLVLAVPPEPAAPYPGKTIFYHSSWTNAAIVYRVGTNFLDLAMTRMGAGRTPGEFLYKVSGIGDAGEDFEFIPHGYTAAGVEEWDHAPYADYGGGNYYTTLDVLFLQDGQIYNYRPPASVSAPQIILTNVNSSVTGIPGRTVRIYLPRGYAENTWKRYPVVYMHDGQNVYYPGGAFGTWDADNTATKEISQGRMREAIIVAIDNNANRLAEYEPPGDTITFEEVEYAGIGDAYTAFIVHNVRPTIDTHYRSWNLPSQTLAIGSSMGGLISTYMGVEGGGVFGKIGALSPSYWATSNFLTRLQTNDTRGVRMYIDGGTGEGSSIWKIWEVYDAFVRDGYVPNDGLRMVVACGQGHNEPAWASRLPGVFHDLLPLWDEPNPLAHEEYPPVLLSATPGLSTNEFSAQFTALHGWRYQLERTTTLIAPAWTPVADEQETYPWRTSALTDPNPPLTGPALYRLIADTPYNP